VVLSVYSASAIVLTPLIEIYNLPKYVKNLVVIIDLTGLQVVNFEIYPHYTPDGEKVVRDYSKISKRKVKTITNDNFIELNIS